MEKTSQYNVVTVRETLRAAVIELALPDNERWDVDRLVVRISQVIDADTSLIGWEEFYHHARDIAARCIKLVEAKTDRAGWTDDDIWRNLIREPETA